MDLSLSFEALASHQRITSLSLSLDLDPEIVEILSQKPLSTLYTFFPNISPIQITFLHFWNTHQKTIKKNNKFIFHAPFPQELIDFMGHIPFFLNINKQDYGTISHLGKAISPKISLDIANATISINLKEEIYLLPSVIPHIIYKNTIAPLHLLFRSTTTDDLFGHGRTSISVSESLGLLEEIKKNNPSIVKYLSAPKIVDAKEIVPVFEFHYNKNTHKYELALFLEALVGDQRQHFPLNLESARKFLNTSTDFVINGTHNTALVVDATHPIRKKIESIVEKSFQNFYSVLGEIQENTIITNDKVNFFEGFLPQIAQGTKIYHVGKKNKLQYILAEESPNISITKASSAPLFGSVDWLSINFEYDHKHIKLSLTDLEKIIRYGFIETDEALISLPDKALDPIKKLFELRKNDHHNELQIQASFLPWILSLYPNIQIPPEWEDLKLFIKEGIVPHVPIPQQSVLRNYQKIGIERLILMHKFGFGMVLADEMGLGKTLQIIALIDLIQKEKKGKSLIVAPTALLLNWVMEIEKFYPNRFKVLVVNGHKQQREEKIKKIDDFDIIITSYHMLGFDLDFYLTQEFHFCIIDEAQHIKNLNSKRSKSVKKVHALCKIAVSGTPIENNIAELWSIFDFIMPGFLGTKKQFQKDYEEPLLGFDTQKRQETLNKLYQICAPFIIRRTKDTVYKELPPKIEQTIITELTTQQKSLYLDTLSKVRNQFQVIIEEHKLNSNRIDFLSALTKLRQISLHPALIYPELESEDPELYSSKMSTLLELLDEALESNHRVLVFSQFVSMLKLIKKELDKRQIAHLYIDGKTNNRIQLTEEFNNGDMPVFLISLRAGGIGLNLTGADTVILFDPWWNPAVENQAIDRAHRIGQNQTVNIYRLMTKGTIEEKIFKLQQKKKFLFDNIMQENSDFGTFSSEDLYSLIAPEEDFS